MQPFKNRKYNPNKPVQVYRCLSRKGNWFSIRQNGLVVGHTEHATLEDCTFHVSENGRQKVKREKKKYVHAWINAKRVHGADKAFFFDSQIKYNPYVTTHFVAEGRIVNHSKAVILKDGHCFGIQITTK